MGRLKLTALLGAAVVALPSAAAFAADVPGPIPVSVGGNWYLRGHIGLAAQSVDHLDNALFAGTPSFRWLDKGHFDAAPIFGGGIGYRFGDHFRVDLTAEYRGAAEFSALDAYGDGTSGPPTDGTNQYSAKKSEITLLANAYWDIMTFGGLTPYVGAGIGASNNTISDFTDVNVPNGGVAYGPTHSQWSFAWAGHAGVSVKVNEALTLDFGYSYTDLGDAASGDLITYQGTNNVYNPMIFKHLTSQDFKVSARWNFGGSQTTPYYPTVVKY